MIVLRCSTGTSSCYFVLKYYPNLSVFPNRRCNGPVYLTKNNDTVAKSLERDVVESGFGGISGSPRLRGVDLNVRTTSSIVHIEKC